MTAKHLQRMLGCISVAEFRDHWLEKSQLHIKQAFEKQEITDLYPMSGIQDLLAHGPLASDRFKVIKNGSIIPNPELHKAGGIDPDFIVDEYAEGSTVLINSVHDFFPSVSRLCRGIAEDCGCVVYANSYITPAAMPGFAPHYDDHDVLILQCYGSKVWSIHDDYEGQRELPLSGFKFDKETNTPGPASQKIIMEPGDVLYIPRGRMHSAATTQSGNSIHLTLSLNWVTWNELIFDLVAKQSLEDIDMRKAIVAHRLGRSIESSSDFLEEQLNRLLKRMLSSANPREALRDFTHSHSSKYFAEDQRRLSISDEVGLAEQRVA